MAAVAGPDARQQLDDAEAGDAVARVFGKAQQRQHVLDMRGFEKFQPAEFHERNVAAGQLDFERAAVVGGAEQHGLRLEREPGLAVLQHRLDHIARLIGFVAHADELRPLGGVALRPEVLGEALSASSITRVGGREDRLRRAIVLLQRDDLGRAA